jgi:hypothetical protein
VRLPDPMRDWLAVPTWGLLATVTPEGDPHAFVVWAKALEDELLLTTTEGRPKHRNLDATRRGALLVQSPDDAYDYVQVRGDVVFEPEGGEELIQELCRAHRGEPFVTPPGLGPRVLIRLRDLELVAR